MTTPVEITQPTDNVSCDKNGKASVVFNVRNIVGRRAEYGVDIIPVKPAQNEWFNANDTFWESRVNAIHQLIVEISVPNTVTSGKYSFKVRVYVKDNPEGEYSKSESITFSFKKPAEPQKVEPEKSLPITEPAKTSWWKHIAALIAAIIILINLHVTEVEFLLYLIAIGVAYFIYGWLSAKFRKN